MISDISWKCQWCILKILISLIVLPPRSNSQECEPGRYGPFCYNVCGKCLNTTCDRDTGVCPDGCQVGYYGDLCNGVCDPGTFGYRCISICHCTSGSCNNVNGVCSVPGCLTGWKGDSCSEPCGVNEFGPDCSNKCYCKVGECSENGTCDDNGCASGWKGQTCSDECEDGYYGEGCGGVCGNCRDFTICNKQTGVCELGCQDGYQSPKCSNTCARKTYGSNCTNVCGHCLDGHPCNPYNGSCPEGCQSGWKGHTCTEKEDKNMAPYYIGGGIAAGIVLMLIVVAVIVVVKRRRRSVSYKDRESVYEPTVKETLYPRKYDKPEETQQEAEDRAYYNAETQTMYYNPGKTDKATSSSDENMYEYVAEGDHCITLNELESVVKDMKKNKGFQQEFQLIPNENDLTTSAADDPANKIKNRNAQTLPYDKTRVILELEQNKPNSDYINASFIDGIDKPHAYIATQAPRKNTVGDFWRMIWQINSVIVIMLTKLQENRKSCCEQYWPETGDEFTLEDLKVSTESQKKYAFFNIRTINVFNASSKETRTVKQFHFHDWSENSLPDPVDLCMFHRRVSRNADKLQGPIVVHCSDGSERTGTFIALDALFTQGKNIGRINIPKFIQNIRKERKNMCQSLDHFRFLHDALIEAFRADGLIIQKTQIVTVLKSSLERGGSIRRNKQGKEFERLKSSLPRYIAHHYLESKDPANKKKNRNTKVLAVSKYRVVLRLPVAERTDYINAVKVPSFTKSLGFLVTSFPLRDTAVDFWRMLYDNNCNTIVSLVEVDHIKESILWWPKSGGTMTSLPFTVQRGNDRKITDSISIDSISVRHEDSTESKVIKVFEVTSWSRKNVLPPNFEILLKLAGDVHEWLNADGSPPVTVMSLDGAVRCGLFCAIYNITESIKMDVEVDVFEVIRQLKIRRPEFIQTSEQYSFCCDFARYITPEDSEYLEPQ